MWSVRERHHGWFWRFWSEQLGWRSHKCKWGTLQVEQVWGGMSLVLNVLISGICDSEAAESGRELTITGLNKDTKVRGRVAHQRYFMHEWVALLRDVGAGAEEVTAVWALAAPPLRVGAVVWDGVISYVRAAGRAGSIGLSWCWICSGDISSTLDRSSCVMVVEWVSGVDWRENGKKGIVVLEDAWWSCVSPATFPVRVRAWRRQDLTDVVLPGEFFRVRMGQGSWGYVLRSGDDYSWNVSWVRREEGHWRAGGVSILFKLWMLQSALYIHQIKCNVRFAESYLGWVEEKEEAV